METLAFEYTYRTKHGMIADTHAYEGDLKVEDFWREALIAYGKFTYCNKVSVTFYTPEVGSTTLTYDPLDGDEPKIEKHLS